MLPRDADCPFPAYAPHSRTIRTRRQIATSHKIDKGLLYKDAFSAPYTSRTVTFS
jgi:hypothetical protein